MREAGRRFSREIEGSIDCLHAKEGRRSVVLPPLDIPIVPAMTRRWANIPWLQSNYDPGLFCAPGFVENDRDYGDRGQSDFESDKVLGRFLIKCSNAIVVRYSPCQNGIRKFKWEAEMYVEDHIGFDEEDLLYDYIGWMAPGRDVIRARWPITGSGECCCNE